MEKKSQLAKNMLITGHRGFIGKNLFQYFLGRGYVVNGIDLKDGDDLRSLDLLRRLIRSYKPDYVFHLAAITQVGDGLKLPKHCIENNILSTINICEVAKEFGFKLIHMSTDKVYGEGLDKKEGHILSAKYPYDVSKLCCENIVNSYKETFGIKCVIARSCNVYGMNDDNINRIIPTVLAGINDDLEIKIRSNGKLKRDYIYIDDLLNGLELIMDENGVYNISSGENLSVLDILDIVKSILPEKIKYVILNHSNKEIINQSLDFNKIRRLGFTPKHTMAKFLGEYLCKYQ